MNTLLELSTLIPDSLAAHVAVCEFSAEDNTPTLHVDLWRGFDLSDLHESICDLNLVAEGFWDDGRSFSFQASH